MTEIHVSGTFKYESELAYLVDIPDRGEVWIPKSIVLDITEDLAPGDDIDIFVPQWFADREGL